MDLRYEGQQGEPDLVMREALNSGGNTFAVMSTLMDWHFQDTVDQFELDRNDAIHNMQGNRNPFIDHPELVHYVYGDSVGVAWNPFMDVIIIECGFGEPIKYYPNPADTELHLETPFEGTAHLTSVDGKRFEFEHILGTNRIDVSHLPSGQYTLGFSDGTKEKVLIVH